MAFPDEGVVEVRPLLGKAAHRGGVDLSHDAKHFLVVVRPRVVVGPDDHRGSLDGDPVPATAEHNCRRRSGTQVAQLPVSPLETNPTTGSSVRSAWSTPALTTDALGAPVARVVMHTASPDSRRPRSCASDRSVTPGQST